MEPETSSDQRPVIQAREILAKIERGEDVEYDGVIVEGDLDIGKLNLFTKDRIEAEKMPGLPEKLKVISSQITITNSKVQSSVDFSNAHFKELINLWRAEFGGAANFTGAEFVGNANIWEANFGGNANFVGAKFIGEDANFGDAKFDRRADFNGAEFDGNANFTEAKFNGNADFNGANFNEYASFRGAKFTGVYADFNGAEFGGIANFNKAEFGENSNILDAKFIRGSAYFRRAKFIGGYADFVKATFCGNTNFVEAEFDREVNFGEAKFIGIYAEFDGAKFDKEANFWGAGFGRPASFVRAEFSGDTYFTRAEFGGAASFVRAKFGGTADFTGAEFGGDANFTDGNFCWHADFSRANFRGDTKFDIDQFSKDVSFNGAIFDRPVSQEKACRIAKRTMESQGNKKAADDYFYREMEAIRIRNGLNGVTPKDYPHPRNVTERLSQFKAKMIQIPSKIKRFLIYDVLEYIFIQRIFGYGVRPFNVAKAWLIVVFTLGFVYWIGSGVEKANNTLEWYEYFYFSIVTAATPGYAGYTPATGFYTLIAGAQAIFGTFMWAAFIATFARKWQR